MFLNKFSHVESKKDEAVVNIVLFQLKAKT